MKESHCPAPIEVQHRTRMNKRPTNTLDNEIIHKKKGKKTKKTETNLTKKRTHHLGGAIIHEYTTVQQDQKQKSLP